MKKYIITGLFVYILLVNSVYSESVYPKYFNTEDYQMELISNTDNCFSRCEAIIDITNIRDKDISTIELKKIDLILFKIPIPFTKDPQMSFRFEKGNT